MEPPDKPAESDCCNSGCNPCILDVYEQQLKKYKESSTPKEVQKSAVNCMKPTSYSIFNLVKITQHTPTTKLLTFAYFKSMRPALKGDATTSADLSLLYDPGQHFLMKAASRNGEGVFTRAYTPIPISVKGDLQFTILARLYEDGKMSNYLERLKVDDETCWRGPYGDYPLSYDRKRILCIVQGTGVAPIYAIVDKLVQNEECFTFIHAFCCYRSSGEILLRDELYGLASYWNFTYEMFLSDGSGAVGRFGEKIHIGRLKGEDVETYVTVKGLEGMQVLICGSEAFEEAMERHVRDCGVEDVFVF